ncbi:MULTISPECIES: hypothetical protein [Metallosphaera]|uniref:Uncharacterized protein n=3 Tax=Metallosphaera TaxID=41980 RepID=A4YFN3_METS5|nr:MULTISPECIES: hypothetical protein [Metallosphaera]ABP95235.1 hypothetical protein Msed_1071 [Metallosphaera sedula DSM 5348]AIM27221.1 hypothetical protein HA72_1071 [Metallosphaera sedula]AKV74115.1 hypothetical protein MsedA_1084 [Metallosphaera sedula]AKV76355.1 hypothetical protein MsedB_1086 [Metallosphaera sedula]AKV78606.1 hypothetical protein MsedC_1084 [Metallosphaera sedula]
MGRTIPSYTGSVDRFISELERISQRTGYLEDVLAETKRRIRYFQNASYDESIDTQTLVLVAMISVIEDMCKGRLKDRSQNPSNVVNG